MLGTHIMYMYAYMGVYTDAYMGVYTDGRGLATFNAADWCFKYHTKSPEEIQQNL